MLTKKNIDILKAACCALDNSAEDVLAKVKYLKKRYTVTVADSQKPRLEEELLRSLKRHRDMIDKIIESVEMQKSASTLLERIQDVAR